MAAFRGKSQMAEVSLPGTGRVARSAGWGSRSSLPHPSPRLAALPRRGATFPVSGKDIRGFSARTSQRGREG